MLTAITPHNKRLERTAEKPGRSAAGRWAASRISLEPEYNPIMSIKEIEAAVLKLVPRDRARLAGKLLESLEDLSDEENEVIWAQEAERRDSAWNSSDRNRSAKSGLLRARAKLR